jgi:cation transport regulator ChaB
VPTSHRELGSELFNNAWSLLESRADDDLLVHCAHASAYHWAQVGTAANRARSEWQCARVYSELGRPEPALHHARRCLAIVESAPGEMEEWDLPSAYEALARAHAVAGAADEAERYRQLGLEAVAEVADQEDRAPIEADLRGIPMPSANVDRSRRPGRKHSDGRLRA